jgi:DNA-directed RNA polymerase specialized sigma24 family protein
MNRERLDAVAEDPEAFLSRGLAIRRGVAAKRREIDRWRGIAESITARLSHDGGLATGGPKRGVVETAAASIVDLEYEIAGDLDTFAKAAREIRGAIYGLLGDARQMAVLEMLYLNGLTRSEAGLRLGCDDWQVGALRAAAVRALRERAESIREKAIYRIGG